jgi:hypothetical protein
MIAFGCATTDEEEYRRRAAPSIARLAEPSSLLMRRHGFDSIHAPYNEMLAEAAGRNDLEALVLIHQDLSIDEDGFLAKVRGLLATRPEVAVIGAAGARGVRGLAWWEGDCRGRVHAPVLVPGGGTSVYSHGHHEVESVDGMLLVLSAWAVRELRFDRGIGPFDGYDMDICLQARERGRRVLVADVEVSHYVRYESFFDRERWIEGAVALQRKWAFERPS